MRPSSSLFPVVLAPKPVVTFRARLLVAVMALFLASFLSVMVLSWHRLLPYPPAVSLLHSLGSLADRPVATLNDLAANRTLGFEKILALSPRPSWRTRGLLAAADLTGLDIAVPTQVPQSRGMVSAFRSLYRGRVPLRKGGVEGSGAGAAAEKEMRTPGVGSASAWLAHLDLLRFVVASGLETALIVEDDVDWDARVKEQMRLVAQNVRVFTGEETTPVRGRQQSEQNVRGTSAGAKDQEQAGVAEENGAPYGTEWDVLWLGHCGSWLTTDMRARPFRDDTRCATNQYTNWARESLSTRLADGHRQIHESLTTVCSFGYAVTQRGAARILELEPPGLAGSGRGGDRPGDDILADEAFDVALSAYCRPGGKLRCLVVTPQVFNHYQPPAGSERWTSLVRTEDKKGEPETGGVPERAHQADDPGLDEEIGVTADIARSARCEALFHDTCLRTWVEL